MDRADVWVALTDGGAGLEDFLRVYFPRAECVLDFYHAAEHLNDLAKALYPDEAEVHEAAGAWCHVLKHEGGSALLATLEALDPRGRKAAAREAYRRETGYLRNNLHRMDYPRYVANGWLIGSGHVEAACKSVVGQRLKGGGMRLGGGGGRRRLPAARPVQEREGPVGRLLGQRRRLKNTNTKDAHPAPHRLFAARSPDRAAGPNRRSPRRSKTRTCGRPAGAWSETTPQQRGEEVTPPSALLLWQAELLTNDLAHRVRNLRAAGTGAGRPVARLRYTSCRLPWRTNSHPACSNSRIKACRFIRPTRPAVAGRRPRGRPLLRYHQVVGVLDVLPEFLQRFPLAEDAWDFQQPPDVEGAVPPKLQRKPASHRLTPGRRSVETIHPALRIRWPQSLRKRRLLRRGLPTAPQQAPSRSHRRRLMRRGRRERQPLAVVVHLDRLAVADFSLLPERSSGTPFAKL